jgi:Ca-activated chloride channel family protein
VLSTACRRVRQEQIGLKQRTNKRMSSPPERIGSQSKPARVRHTVTTLVLSLLILSGRICAAEEPIRVGVNLVNVAFSVRDQRGALVDSLSKADVEVLEDAVPQKISFFARSLDVPLTLGLIVDVSGSQEHFNKQHQRDLEVFLKDVLGSNDRAFLVSFGNHIRLVSDFSQSPSDLLDRLQHESRHFPELGPHEKRDLGTAFYDAIYYSVHREAGERERPARTAGF